MRTTAQQIDQSFQPFDYKKRANHVQLYRLLDGWMVMKNKSFMFHLSLQVNDLVF